MYAPSAETLRCLLPMRLAAKGRDKAIGRVNQRPVPRRRERPENDQMPSTH